MRHRLLVTIASALPLVAVACTDSHSAPADPPDPDVDSGPPPAGEDAGPPPNPNMTTLTAQSPAYRTQPSQERTQCMSVNLGNEGPVYVREIRARLTEGSHHMIVYRLDEPADPTPSDCSAFAHGTSDSLFIAQQRDATLRYPDGAGLRFEANQTIGIELHYINYFGDGPEDIQGTVEFDVVPASDDLDEVRLIFQGNLSLYIEARSTETVRSFQPIVPGARIFGLTTHTHELGTYASLHRARSESDVGQLLHESRNWSEPPLDIFDPPLMLEAGEGLVLTCEYDNPRPVPVTFGTGFQDEMCFFWAYIY